MFALVVCVGILGLLHDSWPKETQKFWINIHALMGLSLWLLLFARLGWRSGHSRRRPSKPAARLHGARRARAFRFYVLLFVIPIVGIVTFVYHGRIFDFGLFKLDLRVKSNRAVFHPTEDLHGYLAYALFSLAGIHAATAYGISSSCGIDLLARMWPARMSYRQ